MIAAACRLLRFMAGKIMTIHSGCIFCQIGSGKLPAAMVYQDDQCFAFDDVNPKAPVHVLVVPRRHIATLADGGEDEKALLGHLLFIAARVAATKGIRSFRTVINTNAEAGQTIYHLHIHVLGGRLMRWPPG